MKMNVLNYLAVLLLCCISCTQSHQLQDDGLLVPATVLEDPTLPAIEVGGLLLHAETFGNPTDPMLVVLHGGPGADYRGVLNFKALADDGLFVVFYDQRGSGLSQRLDENAYSEVQFFIDELAGVINYYRQYPTQKVILAGHSWGAMLATAYVNQFPDEISGLILAEPGGLTWEQTEAYISRVLQLQVFQETTNDFVYQDQFLTGSDHNTLDYKMALSTAGDVRTGDPSLAPYWRFGAVCNAASIKLASENPDQLNFTTNLSQFNKKVLFAFSALNPSYGAEHAALVAAPLPNVDLVEIADCGHEIPHFGWNNFYPLIQNYLTEIL